MWHEAPPALRGPDGTSHEWSDFAPELLPRLFETFQPFCWSCNNVNELQQLRPDLVFRRPAPEQPKRYLPPSEAVY